jgi:hypothetical protein
MTSLPKTAAATDVHHNRPVLAKMTRRLNRHPFPWGIAQLEPTPPGG